MADDSVTDAVQRARPDILRGTLSIGDQKFDFASGLSAQHPSIPYGHYDLGT